MELLQNGHIIGPTHHFNRHFPGESGFAGCHLDNKRCGRELFNGTPFFAQPAASKHGMVNGYAGKFLQVTGLSSSSSSVYLET